MEAGAKDAARKVGTGSVQEVDVMNLQRQIKSNLVGPFKSNSPLNV